MIDDDERAAEVDAAATEWAAALGGRILKLREAAGETQAQAAYACDTDSTTWSRWERGVTAPRADAIVAIANHFAVTTDKVLVGDSPRAWEETPEWTAFLATPYGKIAAERGLLETLKYARLKQKMTARVYEALVHMMLSEAADGGSPTGR